MCELCDSNAALHKTADEEEARDRARFGGPITDAMLHTALRVAAYNPDTNPRDAFNLATLANHINSWLKPVAK